MNKSSNKAIIAQNKIFKKRGRQIVVSLIFLLCSVRTIQKENNELIVWNVGQGQFVSSVEGERCLHFDMGGENFESSKIYQLCKKKKNLLFISHDDRDHIKFVAQMNQILNLELCGSPKIFLKFKIFSALSKLSLCAVVAEDVKQIFKEQTVSLINKKFDRTVLKNKSLSNSLGQVYLYRNFLFTGDSPKEVERIWTRILENEKHQKIKIALAGHHGSRTSNSDELIRILNPFAQIVVSSRMKRYGHPHKETIDKFKKFHHPMISTEDWGNLHFIYF